MPSNQLIRQWTLLQELAVSYRGKTMGELGRLLEVSKRTARRDLEDLEAAGFPLEKVEDGKYVRYRLVRGHKPPQIPFDLAEALALFHSTILSHLFHNATYHPLLESALIKLQNAMPPAVREYIGKFKVAFSHRSPRVHNPHLLGIVSVLQEQAADQCRVRLEYENLKGEVSDRVVDPYCLRLYQGEVYLLGYCHLRQAERVFLADRIREVDALNDEFEPPAGFNPERLLDTSLGIYLGEPNHAKIRFRAQAARYVTQRPLHPDQEVLSESSDDLVVRVPIRGDRELFQTVARFGDLAEVLSPPEVREAVAKTLRRAAEQYP